MQSIRAWARLTLIQINYSRACCFSAARYAREGILIAHQRSRLTCFDCVCPRMPPMAVQTNIVSSKKGLDGVIRVVRRSSPYGLALITLIVLVLIRAWLDHWFLGLGSFLIFLPPVIFAAAQGGGTPGLVVTLIGLALGTAFTASAADFSKGNILEALFFAVAGVGISWMGEQLCRTHIREGENLQALRARETHLRSILATVPDATIVICEKV